MDNNSEMLESVQTYEFYQNSEMYKKYFLKEQTTKAEKLFGEALLDLLKDFNQKTLNLELKDFLNGYCIIGYLKDEGYYAIKDFDRGVYNISFLGKASLEAFQYIVADILLMCDIPEEEKDRINLKYGDIAESSYDSQILDAEYALSIWKQYLSIEFKDGGAANYVYGDFAKNNHMIKYLENNINNSYILFSLDNRIQYNMDQQKFELIKKEKTR